MNDLIPDSRSRIRLAKRPIEKKDDLVRSLMQAMKIPISEKIRAEPAQGEVVSRRIIQVGAGQGSSPEKEDNPAGTVVFADFTALPKTSDPAKKIGDLRYLDDVFFDEGKMELARSTAESFGITPRELEIMLFYVYSDFSMREALSIKSEGRGEILVSEASMHLASLDGEKLLRSSYYIYCLRNRSLEPLDAAAMARNLWEDVCAMNKNAPYAIRFFNEAYRLKAIFTSEGPV